MVAAGMVPPPMPLGEPRLDVAIDLQAHLNLVEPSATVKGMFCSQLFEHTQRVSPKTDLAAEANVPARRYLAFKDYPYSEWLRLCVTASRCCFAHLPLAHALRKMGNEAYETMLSSVLGKVLFLALGRDVGRVLENGPRAYGVTIRCGSVTARRVGPKQIQYQYKGMPGLLETYQVGVIEGAVVATGGRPKLAIELEDLAHATIDIQW